MASREHGKPFSSKQKKLQLQQKRKAKKSKEEKEDEDEHLFKPNLNNNNNNDDEENDINDNDDNNDEKQPKKFQQKNNNKKPTTNKNSQSKKNQKKKESDEESNDDESEKEDELNDDDDDESEDDQIKETEEEDEENNNNNQNKSSSKKERKPIDKDLKTIFERESDEEVQQRKLDATRPLDISKRNKPWHVLKEYLNEEDVEMPKRPPMGNLGSNEIDSQEKKAFSDWIQNIENKLKGRINYYEHNIEVWRQLWRVCEMSDILLLVIDSRFPLFHFPPALCHYITKELGKPLTIVFNKQDLVDPRVLYSWKLYFSKHYPHLQTIGFNAFTIYEDAIDANKKRKKSIKTRKYETSVGKKKLLDALAHLKLKKNGKEIDLSFLLDERELSIETATTNKKNNNNNNNNNTNSKSELKSDEFPILTVGMVGHPNVGKSSLINGLMGRKVVSASRTPGHTKHYQTINFSTHLTLLDCPGLVFPALDRPKPLQILCGLFPIAQVREPFSATRYLAERLPIEKIYGLVNPEPSEPWSPYSLCEAYASKRGYFLKRSGRPDVHRAGLEILNDVCDGRLSISWPPPDVDPDTVVIPREEQQLSINKQAEQQQDELRARKTPKYEPFKDRNRKEQLQQLEKKVNLTPSPPQSPQSSTNQKQQQQPVNPFDLLSEE